MLAPTSVPTPTQDVPSEPPDVEVVIEVPRGSFLKRGSSGHIDFVSPLPCPFNYGAVPTLLGWDKARLAERVEELTTLVGLDHALRHPFWPLFLGRKSFVPGAPVPLEAEAVRDASLFESLASFPRAATGGRLRYVIDSDAAGGSSGGETTEPRFDHPVSFARREFRARYVRVGFFPSDQAPTE